MCGRYDLHNPPGALASAMGAAYPHAFVARYNIAPQQTVDILREAVGGGHEWARVRWGLVPRWAKDPAIGLRMVNARAETVAGSKAFGVPFHKHRCLLPADGYYTWQALPNGRKQPLRVTLRHGGMLALAGIAERWLSPEGDVVDTCAIVTTAANAALRDVHPRMPVIVAPDDWQRWLDHAADPPLDLLAAAPADALSAYPVSTRINSTRASGATLIEPVAIDLLPPPVVDSGDAPPPVAAIPPPLDDAPAPGSQAALF